MLRRRTAFALALAAAVTGVTVAAAAPTAAEKKRCKVVTKVVHGKKKRVRVCRTVRPPTTDRPAPALGTQAHPVPVGKAVKIDLNWRLQVLGADPNRTADIVELQRGDPDNPAEPPPPGMQYLLTQVKVTRIAASAGTFSPYSLDLLAASGAQYSSACGIYIDPLDANGLTSGVTATGNACWQLASSDISKVLMLYTNPFTGRATYFSLAL